MKIAVEDRIRVAIERVAFGGSGIGRVGQLVVFVPFTVDGDDVEVEIVEVKKRFLRGKLRRIYHQSPHRINPLCLSFFRCGGCQYQHIDYGHQLKIKEMQVRETCNRIGKLNDLPMQPIIPSPKNFHYRGKAEYHIQYRRKGDALLGFMNEKGKRVIEIPRCEIVDEAINRACETLRRTLGKHSANIKDTRCILWSGANYPNTRDVVRTVKGRDFIVPYDGFFQANVSLVDELVQRVLDMGDFREFETVLECYCGSGLFTSFIAERVRQIFGIEFDDRSVRSAKNNLKQHGISNALFYAGKVENVMEREFIQKARSADAIILDPPRTGCSETVLRGISALMPTKIIYISCNPATLARDALLLSRHTYHLSNLCPVDMFPQTKHIEVVARFDRSLSA